MSDSSEKSELVTKVIDAIYGDTFTRAPKFPKDMPEEIRRRILDKSKTNRIHHKELILELYEKHLSVEQLKELLHFHASEIGKSIKEAQTRIHKELAERTKEKENSSENPEIRQAGYVSYTYKLDDDS